MAGGGGEGDGDIVHESRPGTSGAVLYGRSILQQDLTV